MVGIIIRLLVNALAIFFTAQILPGVTVDGLQSALIVAVVLGIINTFVKPILIFFTLPLTIVTLGLFTFVINALLILLASSLVPGFSVDGFLWALIFSFVLSIVSSILIWIVK
ncbi:hypothetical protein A3H80_04740 [Candidatus Roizmanbacteria bacterium RIFCSPLOWO2_02_FULL_37_19]|uniref:Phage holin family protein n=1 Tax=Candidatus Roizmanbacteria bacterium RIFCSPHIGHO2_02_FULL_37_24 TaxID=1802037 RepID=A0A1F7GZ63_9BACT|nr:MAG: hypothetical protein A2862_00180 [Candidatus Roizmanbacteria bacterium RIFCSPHIGHO2_01_FULL_38_41]OGK24044.1 MAG: hypothetical protein A3C24_02875 [Candidatus Roizmanbacteria bacterium RIFCSPHIGHO2_02_FULL_37_24]OGK32395.1 MAG: hypothetical protein A3E10_04315 [Candidatus Roizmanbacteria bacterium RIFCSPHIGHO2_12_FULL_37_23]OGK44267.1 MAG: hypothetical protein A2956_00240 [Candidatus Roizmanbacteria bacterium RIFCSPLOWO2_01_FULL_37_57]OGK54167.1 MAG: hypothetical protein A3H80_04740 [Ca